MAMHSCPICPHPNKFASPESLERHLAVVHFTCLPYPCVECRGLERYPTKMTLERHYRRDHGLKEEEFKVAFKPSTEETYKLSQIAGLMGRIGGETTVTQENSIATPPSPLPPIVATEPLMRVKQEPEEDHRVADEELRSGIRATPFDHRASSYSPPSRPSSFHRCIAQSVKLPKDRNIEASVIKTHKKLGKAVSMAERQALHHRLTSASGVKQPKQQSKGEGKKRVHLPLKTTKCAKCGEAVPMNRGVLLHHINSKHLHRPLRTCTICSRDFTSYMVLGVANHVNQSHAQILKESGGDRSKIITVHKDEMDKLAGEIEVYFPQ